MTTIAIKPINSFKTKSTTKNTAANNKAPNKSTVLKNNFSIELLAERIAGILKASSALPVKTSKSAAYLLLKNLVKAGENVVTINSVGLYKNEIVRERLGIVVKLTEDESLTSFKNSVDENTKLIYLESLGTNNHIIPDFQKIVAFAKSKNIPVAVDNTTGFAGIIFNPISWGADFSIESFPTWFENNSTLKSLLIERKGLSFSLIEKIRASSVDRPSPLSIPENIFERIKELDSLPLKSRRVSSTALTSAKWLKETTHVKDVEYVGLPTHSSHFNALKYFSGGYGNVLSFSLWANYRSFDFFLDNLIPRSFHLLKVEEINYEQKKITVRILSDDLTNVINHFRNTFELLQKYLGSDYFLYENLYDTQDAVGY